MVRQALQQNLHTSFESLGEGTQDYFGPIHRCFFAANITRDFLKPPVNAERLTLVIDTSSDPYANSKYPDADPALRLVGMVERLFSRDPAVQQAETLAVLNGQLTRMRASDDFMPTLEKVRKSAEGDKEKTHPMVIATAASMLAEKPHKQNHKSIEGVLKAASPEEREKLQETMRVLGQTNDDIEVRTDSRLRTPEIFISGSGLPKALEKLHAAQMIIRDVDASYLHRNLGEWTERNPSVAGFIESELRPVMDTLQALNEMRFERPVVRKRTRQPSCDNEQ